MRPYALRSTFLFAYVFLLLVALCVTAHGATPPKCPYTAAEVETAMEDGKTWVPMSSELPRKCPVVHVNIVRSICERLDVNFPPEKPRSFVVTEKLRRCHSYLYVNGGEEVHSAWDGMRWGDTPHWGCFATAGGWFAMGTPSRPRARR